MEMINRWMFGGFGMWERHVFDQNYTHTQMKTENRNEANQRS